MSKETKTNEETKPGQPDRVATTLAATEKSFADMEAKFANARREVRDQSEAYARAQEERQRDAAQWDYEEEQRRRAVVDRQREEDRERDRRHAEREAAIAAREKAVHSGLAKLLGPCGEPFDPEQAKAAFDKKLAEAAANATKIAEQTAKKEYETKKAIDDANSAKDKALLEAENARLKADNAKLEAENKRLSESVMDMAKRQGELARDAFGSAGGIQRQAMDSLQSAAQSTGRVPPR
jgi:colicin import membrane protein